MSRHTLRRSLIRFLATVVFGFATSHSDAQVAPSWKDVRIPALHAFKPQQPKRIELPNGMVLMLQEDHELPIIDGFARIRGGSREEPAEKIGLVDIFGDAWRTGGTKTKTGDELDDFLEARAAKVETGAMLDSTNVSFSCLKADFEDVFAIFNDVLKNPEFRQEKIDLAKDNNGAEIARRNDNASGIAGREANKLGYGEQNPYARVAEFATIAAIKRQDLIDWHNTHVHPNNILLGIVGDFDSTALEAKLRAAFESWPKGPAAVSSKVDPQPAKPGYYLVEKKDVNQSNINMVELGTKRSNPDYYAITVFNEAFGGGFSSRLFSNIRSKKGLAYGVGGGVGASFDHDGLVHLSMGTKSSTTVEAIQALYEEVAALKTNPLSADEIRRAKDSILNSFIFNFDSPAKVLRERMAYEFYGYPSDYLERYRTGIEKVTPADVARAATKYVRKDQFAVLVVGNTAEFDKPLASMGAVVDTFETACTWDRFDALHAAVGEAVRSAMTRECGGGVMSCRFTHVYPDGPAPYYTFIAPGRDGGEGEGCEEQWLAIKRAAGDALIANGATITHHHAVGRLHRPWYDRQRPDVFARALVAAKHALDPSWVLNPGVLIDRD